MLKPFDSLEEAPPMRPGEPTGPASWPRPKPVWVYSKGQAPYQFRPWASPCSPNEWPYNLEALRGSEDYDDMLAWYCGRNQAVSRDDLDQLVTELIRCVGDRQVSVEIHQDMDTQEYFPWFAVWGFAKVPTDEEDRIEEAFRERRLASPLLHLVMVSFRAGAFENRHVSDWS